MCESVRVVCDVSLKPYTTFGVGGKAKRLVLVKDGSSLLSVLEGEKDPTVIGGGSNLLIGDGGVKRSMVRFASNSAELEKTDDGVYYASGAAFLPRLARRASELSLGGIEFACGLPGTLGGAVKQNAGAYGGDISSVLAYADVFSEGKVQRLSASKLGFAYRSSAFDGVIVGAALRLRKRRREDIELDMATFSERRRASQPSGKSAGCIYKSYGGVPAYRYVIGVGLAGRRIGGAYISEKHANFIINDGTATARDVLKLMEETEEKVYERYGVRLEREVKLIGEF